MAQTKLPLLDKKHNRIPKNVSATPYLLSRQYQKGQEIKVKVVKDFNLRLNESMSQYNALKDRFLQNFFIRQTRRPIYDDLLSRQSKESNPQKNNRHLQNIKKSAYHNIVDLMQKNKLNKLQNNNKNLRQRMIHHSRQQSFLMNNKSDNKSKKLLKTEPKQSKKSSQNQLTKQQLLNYIQKTKLTLLNNSKYYTIQQSIKNQTSQTHQINNKINEMK